MKSVLLRRLPALALALPLIFAGCSKNPPGAGEDMEENLRHFELHEIGAMYQTALTVQKKPPAALKDLQPYEMGFPNGFQALQSKKCIAIWGIDLNSAPSSTVVAYRQEAMTEGGMVLLADQSIKKMTADQLKAALSKS